MPAINLIQCDPSRNLPDDLISINASCVEVVIPEPSVAEEMLSQADRDAITGFIITSFFIAFTFRLLYRFIVNRL